MSFFKKLGQALGIVPENKTQEILFQIYSAKALLAYHGDIGCLVLDHLIK